MDIILYRPLVMIRNHSEKKKLLGDVKHGSGTLKLIIKAINRATQLDIEEGTMTFAGRGEGPAFIRERKYLQSLMPNEVFASSLRRRGFATKAALTASLFVQVLPVFRRLLRLSKRLKANKRLSAADKENFFLCVVEYLVYLYIFTQKKRRPKGVVADSLISPRGLALVGAAMRERIPTIYIMHGACKPVFSGIHIPTFSVDLHLMKSRAMCDAVGLKLRPGQRIAFYGLPGKNAPMRHVPDNLHVLGLCLAYGLKREELESILRAVIDRLKPEKIIARFHPRDSLLETFQMDGVQLSPREESVQKFADGCDVILAGNTSAVLDILKCGCPVLYVPSLDDYGRDIYGFVSKMLVLGFDTFDEISVEKTRDFYTDSEWKSRMVYFDSSYGKDRHLIDEAIKNEILEIFKN